jgi:glucosylglycerate synthase
MKAIEDNPERITQADIVVGMPSYNEADRIAAPVMQADKGLTKYFKGKTCVIVNCDNHSPDGTREAFLAVKTRVPKIYLSTPEGVRGKGNNLRNLFEKVVDLKARAVVVLDADVQSVTPLWIRNLVEPLFEDFGFVTPLYVRHKYDRIITNNIAYPVTRALYGRRVRQPIGGEFGFSGDLARTYLDSDIWTQDVGEFGIDVWMSTLAMINRVTVVQSFLGGPKVHKVRGPDADLGSIFRNIVGTIFDLMSSCQKFWKEVKWSRPTAVFGFGTELEMPPPVSVDTQALWNRFSSGIGQHWDVYKAVLEQGTCAKLEEAAGLSMTHFEFPTALWAKVLYDFAVAHRDSDIPKTQALDALIVLHYGKTLSFVTETEAMNNQQAEEIIEDQCLQFEKCKPYLLERWFPE